MNIIRARQLESGANYNRLVNPSKSRTQFDEATNLLEMTNR